MTEQPRDWDKELANIDKVIAQQKGPTAPSPSPARAVPAATSITAPTGRGNVVLTWFWVGLAGVLAAALPLWPYPKPCGLGLTFFLGATGLTAILGVIAALTSWSHRRGLAQLVSLLIILWAGVVAVREVLPRIGYAKQSLTWLCPAAPAPAAP